MRTDTVRNEMTYIEGRVIREGLASQAVSQAVVGWSSGMDKGDTGYNKTREVSLLSSSENFGKLPNSNICNQKILQPHSVHKDPNHF